MTVSLISVTDDTYVNPLHVTGVVKETMDYPTTQWRVKVWMSDGSHILIGAELTAVAAQRVYMKTVIAINRGLGSDA